MIFDENEEYDNDIDDSDWENDDWEPPKVIDSDGRELSEEEEEALICKTCHKYGPICLCVQPYPVWQDPILLTEIAPPVLQTAQSTYSDPFPFSEEHVQTLEDELALLDHKDWA